MSCVISMVFLSVALHYVADVIFGMSMNVFGSEIGFEPADDRPTRMSHLEFFTRVVPMVAMAIGLPICLSVIWREGL
jgi:hypothetical protein